VEALGLETLGVEALGWRLSGGGSRGEALGRRLSGGGSRGEALGGFGSGLHPGAAGSSAIIPLEKCPHHSHHVIIYTLLSDL